MFSQTCAIPSVHGGMYPRMQWGRGCVSQHAMGQGVSAQEGVCLGCVFPGGVTPPGDTPHAPLPRWPLKGTVRIQLECILVYIFFFRLKCM